MEVLELSESNIQRNTIEIGMPGVGKPARSCGSCTMCCEGTLTGKALGFDFYPGSPCGAVELGKGCTRYEERPSMCRDFECVWKRDSTYPSWMKPSAVNALATIQEVEGIEYATLIESPYQKTDTATVLAFVQWAHDRYGNVKVDINGGWRYFGTPEFCDAMRRSG